MEITSGEGYYVAFKSILLCSEILEHESKKD